jgi:hypothetical protein
LKNNGRTEGKSMNEAGTGAYSCAEAVPSDARAFGRWYQKHSFPPDLDRLAMGAWLTLCAMEDDPMPPSLDTLNRRDLQAFVEAYEAWSHERKSAQRTL